MKKLFTYLLLLTAFFLGACSGDDELSDDSTNSESYYKTHPGRRTIIAYITGDNNLSSQLSSGDVAEMLSGSEEMPADCRLVLLGDFSGSKPYIAHFSNGELVRVRDFANDFYTTSADSMRSIMQWIIDNYPSEEYAAVIEGHGSGPLVRTDTIATNMIMLKAYGYDDTGEESATSTRTWMNIPSMASALNALKDKNGNKVKMSYILFDCCCMQSVEVAYELRNATDYIIAPLSETPGKGADYTKMVPALCADKEVVADSVVTVYSQSASICISAIRTDRLDALCQATRTALQTIYKSGRQLELNRRNCIYYYRGDESSIIPVLHDMKHIMKINLGESAYEEWLPYLEEAVVAKHLVKKWDTNLSINFNIFQDYLTDEYYGGVSMIAPTTAYDDARSDINTLMFQLAWCNDVGWKQFGW